MSDAPQSDTKKNGILTVLDNITKGIPPAKIPGITGLSKRQVQYAITRLRRSGNIRKIGYGTWEVVESKFDEKSRYNKVQKTHRVGSPHTPPEDTKMQDTVRGHGITATVKIPKLFKWDERERLLEKRGIPFEKIPQGQRISFKGVEKVWLCKKSLVLYLPQSWYAESAKEAAWYAMSYILDTLRELERYLGVTTFKVKGGYQVKFSRHHYALIKNSLATQYNEEKKKLFVFDDRGLWLLVDNSKPDNRFLQELEAVRPGIKAKDNAIYHNRVIQKFFNELKETEFSPKETADLLEKAAQLLNQSAEQDLFYRKNIASHVLAIKELSESAKKLAEAQERIESAIIHKKNGQTNLSGKKFKRAQVKGLKKLGGFL